MPIIHESEQRTASNPKMHSINADAEIGSVLKSPSPIAIVENANHTSHQRVQQGGIYASISATASAGNRAQPRTIIGGCNAADAYYDDKQPLRLGVAQDILENNSYVDEELDNVMRTHQQTRLSKEGYRSTTPLLCIACAVLGWLGGNLFEVGRPILVLEAQRDVDKWEEFTNKDTMAESPQEMINEERKLEALLHEQDRKRSKQP